MTFLLDRPDFLSAERAARAARRQAAASVRRELDRTVEAAEQAFRAARTPACAADRLDLDRAFDAVHELAELTDVFCTRSEGVLDRLSRADPALVAPDPHFGDLVSETVADRLVDADLARLYGAAVRRREADR